MKKIIAILAMATSMSAYAQSGVENFRVEVTDTTQGQASKTYLLQGKTSNKLLFAAQHKETPISSPSHALYGFNFYIQNTKNKNQYIVEVKDISTSGFSGFQDDETFVAQKIQLVSHQSQELIVSDKLKFKITAM